jgi:prepilin-type N-terminal cleavage/methylation domain-containing protein
MQSDSAKQATIAGFTLIELSIVLVIIGLLAGAISIGRDLISAAEVRAQISQIEKYQTAVNTFRGKYGYLPGDIPDPTASQYGFQARGQYAGEGDGNGILEGIYLDQPNNNGGYLLGTGESTVAWVDLSASKLIEGSFNAASTHTGDANNYFGLASVLGISGGWSVVSPTGSLSVSQAYNIDNKIDDGLPISGRVNVMFPVSQSSPGSVLYSWKAALNDSNPFDGINYSSEPTNQPENPNATTCYDNNHVAGAVMHYSMSINNGAGMNCALSFRFQ